MIEIAEPYKDILEKIDSIIGIDITAALLILAEIGSDVQKNFQTASHLCSWAGLKPRNDDLDVFEKYVDCFTEYTSLIEAQAFEIGFKLAVKMLKK